MWFDFSGQQNRDIRLIDVVTKETISLHEFRLFLFLFAYIRHISNSFKSFGECYSFTKWLSQYVFSFSHRLLQFRSLFIFHFKSTKPENNESLKPIFFYISLWKKIQEITKIFTHIKLTKQRRQNVKKKNRTQPNRYVCRCLHNLCSFFLVIGHCVCFCLFWHSVIVLNHDLLSSTICYSQFERLFCCFIFFVFGNFYFFCIVFELPF